MTAEIKNSMDGLECEVEEIWKQGKKTENRAEKIWKKN